MKEIVLNIKEHKSTAMLLKKMVERLSGRGSNRMLCS